MSHCHKALTPGVAPKLPEGQFGAKVVIEEGFLSGAPRKQSAWNSPVFSRANPTENGQPPASAGCRGGHQCGGADVPRRLLGIQQWALGPCRQGIVDNTVLAGRVARVLSSRRQLPVALMVSAFIQTCY